MKHFIYLPICVLMNALFFVMMLSTSCSKNEPDLPVIIKSEVIDEGIDARVTTKSLPGGSGTGSAGTEVSYNSWIKVMAETASGNSSAPANAPKRASSNGNAETIRVLLKDVFHNLDTTIIVDSFDFGEPTTDITYTTNGSRRQGYVTITDSVIHYNVNFDGFSFRYMIEYEVAVYDDGYSRVVMPYHKIKKIRDNGYTIEDMSFVIETNDSGSEDVYLRKKIKHSITVELNGEDYKLTGNVILKRRVGTHPCLVNSELIDMGISDIKNYYYYTTYKSWAKVKHQYSDNRTETKTYSIDMEGELNYKLYPGIECNSGNITLNSIEIRDTDYNEIISVSDTVLSVKNFSRVLVVTYNQFTDARLLNEYHAFYDDNLISFEFPCITYGEAKVDFNVREVASDESWTTYIFQGRLDVQFGDAWHYNLLEFLINVKN